MGFVMDELAQWVAFKPVCPEMAIGLPVPRPALRLVQTPVREIRMRFSHAPHEDVTEKMATISPALTSLQPWAGCVRLYRLRQIAEATAGWSACGGTMKKAIAGMLRKAWGCLPAP
ncbi:2-thiouracil desulfurase family protein [Klebsiella pneumoniae]|nr:2-thiouracil desulfurase family protein [Klebsiella pneumoniae]